MNSSTGSFSFSLKSTSDSSSISEEPRGTELFPNCENLCLIKKLSDAKFPVYLVNYTPTNVLYALKVFPWENKAPSPFFINEVRFAQFCHPHIVSIVYHEYEQEALPKGSGLKLSYLLMEYAKYGDFFDVLISEQIAFDEKLVRTYFHQLIGGLEALHSNGAAHLDLKLENLLMNDDFRLKLVDFDLSYLAEDGQVKTRGTKNFRAPEMFKGTCENPQAADVYSAGILLFLMKTSGLVPYQEDDSEGEIEGLTKLNPKKFWEKQVETLGKKFSFFSEDFKSLFMRMTKLKPSERSTIAQLKSSKWYNKEIYSQEELQEIMSEKFKLM